MKRTRILSLGLAMALLFAQTAQAETFIEPFGTTQESQDAAASQNSETAAAAVQAEPQNQGPGWEEQMASQAMVPSAGYSTKEPVQQAANPTGEQTASQQTASSSVIEEPVIAAEAAILYDVTHGRVLFGKNTDKKLYPASTTKLMTALLVLENTKPEDMVTFSQSAVTGLESGAVTLNLQAGDRVSVKDCLYGLMLKSANEVANGLAEHVSGSVASFAELMNARAAALGCTGTNFVNPSGLNDPEHYTTCYDLAKIAAAAFQNETLSEIASTLTYSFPATKAAAERTITMGHKMLYPTDSRYYEGIVGGKTGYTSLAGNTLVTCVERDGVRMIAVVLKSKSTHYSDTKALLDYGYALEAAGACTAGGSGQSAMYHRWIEDGSSWRFELADGTRLANCFVQIDGVEYAFDTEGRMATGWKTLGTSWHYFDSSGAMVKNDWRQDAGYWFYLGADGAMVKNAWIDNQYYVGSDGIWVEG